MTRDEEMTEDSLDELDDKERLQEIRRGIDLATTLERIEKNFVITDPRLPDNPIVSEFTWAILQPHELVWSCCYLLIYKEDSF